MSAAPFLASNPYEHFLKIDKAGEVYHVIQEGDSFTVLNAAQSGDIGKVQEKLAADQLDEFLSGAEVVNRTRQDYAQTLKDFSLLTFASDVSSVRKFLSEVPKVIIFGHLEASRARGDASEIELCCNVLRRIFNCEEAPVYFTSQEMIPFIDAGLSHDVLQVRQLTAGRAKSFISVSPSSASQRERERAQSVATWLRDTGMIGRVMERLGDEDTGVAEAAGDVAVEFCRLHAHAPAELRLATSLLGALLDSDAPPVQPAPALPSIRRLRVLAALCRIGALGVEALEAVKEEGLIEELLVLLGGLPSDPQSLGLDASRLHQPEAASGDDPLLALNALELLPLLAASHHSFTALLSSGMLERLLVLSAGEAGEEAASWSGQLPPFLAAAASQPWMVALRPLLSILSGPALSALAEVWAAARSFTAVSMAGDSGVEASVARVGPALVAATEQQLAHGDAVIQANALAALAAYAATSDQALGLVLASPTLLPHWARCTERGGAEEGALRTAALAAAAVVMQDPGAPRRALSTPVEEAAGQAVAAVAGTPEGAAGAAAPSPAGGSGKLSSTGLLQRLQLWWRLGGEGGGEKLAAALLQYLRTPLHDVRMACFALLHAALSLPPPSRATNAPPPPPTASPEDAPGAASGGAEAVSGPVADVLRTAAFPEFLFQRDSETTKAGKEWKHLVVHSLLAHPDCETILGRRQTQLLQERARQGPFFVPPETE